mgnify:CR=1 FL=1
MLNSYFIRCKSFSNLSNVNRMNLNLRELVSIRSVASALPQLATPFVMTSASPPKFALCVLFCKTFWPRLLLNISHVHVFNDSFISCCVRCGGTKLHCILMILASVLNDFLKAALYPSTLCSCGASAGKSTKFYLWCCSMVPLCSFA